MQFILLGLGLGLVTAQNDCRNTPGLCLRSFNFRVGQSVELFWNKDQIPVTVNPEIMELSLYQGEIHFITQPCQIDQQKYPLIGKVPFTYSPSGSSQVSIHPSQKLSEAILKDNRFFFQLGNSANVNCQIGPNANSGAITSFSLNDVPLITTTSAPSNTQESLPTSTSRPSDLSPPPPASFESNESSSRLSTKIIIIIAVASFIFLLLLILLILRTRRRSQEKLTPIPDRTSTDLQSLVPSKSNSEPVALRLDPELGIFFKSEEELLPPGIRPSEDIRKLTTKDALDISTAFKEALSGPVKDGLKDDSSV